VLYAVSEKDNPIHVKVFEIYRGQEVLKLTSVGSFQEITSRRGSR